MVYKRFSVSCSLYNRQLKKPDTERAKRLGQLLFFMTGERESTMSSMSTQSVSLKQHSNCYNFVISKKMQKSLVRFCSRMGALREIRGETRQVFPGDLNCAKCGVVFPGLTGLLVAQNLSRIA